MMSIPARRELLVATAARYKAAKRTEKGRILDEFCAATEYHRKYAISVLGNLPCNAQQSKKGGASKSNRDRPEKRTRKRTYNCDVEHALISLWEIASRPCGKCFAPFLPELVAALERHEEIKLDEKTRALLMTISPATADRLLQKTRRQYALRGLST